ncbi:MAG: processive 1,2-diacylglycerol beta-glucosyltransferase, partial [Gammaproteobacteria bacterium]|nr:processive 1,2-diacylglycerol beta-glucosyltransferase [Gammaproteobacteria bacterium]
HADPVIPAAAGGQYASDRALFALFFAMARDGKTLVAGGLRAKVALMKWSWARLVGRLEQKIRRFAPHVVVSTQMIPAALVSYIKQSDGLTLPSIAVPTDFGLHDFWDQSGTDLYCLGHDDIGELPVGLDGRRVVTTGIPLMGQFTRPIDKREARCLLGLRGDRPVITVLGGGLGLGVDFMTERLLQGRTQTQLLVATGRNARAGAKLAVLVARFPSRIRHFQWTERVDVLIRAADLVVAKPGGLTVAEVLACGRPLLAARSLRGQEGFNTRFILKHQAGLLLEDGDLARQIDSLLGNPDQLNALTARAWSLGRRNGADEIAAHVLARAFAKGQLPKKHNA